MNTCHPTHGLQTMTDRTIIPPLRSEGVLCNPLEPGIRPKNIVVLRFHAFGDTIITLPVLAALRKRFPEASITFVTSAEYVELFSALPMLNAVHPVTTRGPRFQRLISLFPVRSGLDRPDLLLDLQRSRLSRTLAAMLLPTAGATFDRYAPTHALERYMEALARAGIENLKPCFQVPFPEDLSSRTLERYGLTENSGPLVCLNPAGCWPTKNWPSERYAELGSKLAEHWNARILLLGTDNVREGAHAIERELGDRAINLVGKTTPLEALAIIRRLSLMVSDDSGLMHLAWTNGVPAIGIFGASRSVWSRPLGKHTRHLGSEDLSCGACMQENCLRNDRICLTRITVEEVFGLCSELLGSRPDHKI